MKKYFIDGVNEYLIHVTEICKDISRKDLTNRYLYRGQRKATGHVLPAIIRDDMFDTEAKMISEAYARRPVIFKDQNSPFERLTRLQHYGLKTRLLDLTLNPLVALYFACEEADNNTSTKENGVVYGYDADVDCLPHNSKEIQIHSAIVEMDIKDGITLEDLSMELKDMNIISSLDLKNYSNTNYYDFIQILEGNYFVISNLSNDRLIQQCGAFYMPGCLEIKTETEIKGGNEIQKRIVKKTKGKGPDNSLVVEFSIPANCKKEILKELDYYNINKASLFPEFEYQMQYITSQNCKDETPKTKQEEKPVVKPVPPITKMPTPIDYNDESDEIVRNVIEKHPAKGVDNTKIIEIFKKYRSFEWYNKPSSINTIRKNLKRFLMDTGKYPHDEAVTWTNELFTQLSADLMKEHLIKGE